MSYTSWNKIFQKKFKKETSDVYQLSLNYLSTVYFTTMFVEHHVVASYNLLSLQIINHFNFILMLILQSQLNDIVLQFK